jgi:DNA polymerase IV
MGVDEREVEPEHDAKSIGHEETFSADITEADSAGKELLALAGRVARRMRQELLRGRTVTLKVKYSDFVLITRSATLPRPTDDASEIYSSVCGLLSKTSVGGKPVRLLGIYTSFGGPPGLRGLGIPLGRKGLYDFNRASGSSSDYNVFP